jgi:hypothetical protein
MLPYYFLQIIQNKFIDPLCAKMKTFQSRSFLIWSEWGVPEGSIGECNSAPMSEFAGLGGIRSCAPMLLFRPFSFGGAAWIYSLFSSCDFWSMVKSKAENIMKAGLDD